MHARIYFSKEFYIIFEVKIYIDPYYLSLFNLFAFAKLSRVDGNESKQQLDCIT